MRLQKIAEMTITIEDLEALKELNDELEENHVETEKQLHDEIGALSLVSLAKESLLTLEQNKRRQLSEIRRTRLWNLKMLVKTLK